MYYVFFNISIIKYEFLKHKKFMVKLNTLHLEYKF